MPDCYNIGYLSIFCVILWKKVVKTEVFGENDRKSVEIISKNKRGANQKIISDFCVNKQQVISGCVSRVV